MMFLIVGVIYDRAHHREIERFGGLGLQMPRYLALATVGFFASLGLPGFSGFISEVMVFLGAFKANSTTAFPQFGNLVFNMKILTMIGCAGVVLGAAYLLYTIQRVYLGPPRKEYEGFPDLQLREYAALVPLGALALLLGILPHLALNVFSGAMSQMLTLWKMDGAATLAAAVEFLRSLVQL
jgi:NADH-quinone oxidoreductase subunit M